MRKTQDREIRWWAVAIILFGSTGLLTCVVKHPGFWSSYVLDITGPAWNYILIRGLFTPTKTTALSRYFTPEITIIFIIGTCYLIEFCQYIELYDSHYDPYDFLAYVSGVLPCYIADKWSGRQRSRPTDNT